MQDSDIGLTFGTTPIFQRALDHEIAPGAELDLVRACPRAPAAGLVYSIDPP
jgi:hypothetical protein